jgi:hypothetical protein
LVRAAGAAGAAGPGAVAVDDAIEVAGDQPEMLQLQINDDLGIPVASPVN